MWFVATWASLLAAILAFVKPVQAQGWPYQGCYTDNILSRTLRGEHFTDASSTSRSLCTLTCAHRDFSYAGLEFGKECYCGYLLNPAATLTSDAECNMPCAGNPEEDCGAADRISVYYNGNPLPTIQPTAGTFSYTGCYTDSVSNRVLPFRADFPFGTDPDRCTAACKTSGYKYAGLEFGSECCRLPFLQSSLSLSMFIDSLGCGDSVALEIRQPDDECYMRCRGSVLQICGAPDRLTLYEDNDVQ